MGFHSEDLDFLKDHPYIRSVSLSDASKIDISGLRYLKNLERLIISDNKQPIDLTQFTNLQEFRAEWHSQMRITSDCMALRILDLSKYKPKSKDLTELPDLPVLEDLAIIQSHLVTIEGIHRFRGLKRLELSYLSKLGSLAAIESLKSERLEILDCQKCRKMQNHDAIRHVTSLRQLKFNDCGEIPSISFLNEMSNLEDFRFVNTNIVDGDLRPCLRLKGVGFFAKKHYSHTPDEIDAILGADSSG